MVTVTRVDGCGDASFRIRMLLICLLETRAGNIIVPHLQLEQK